jgi:hypothetical protein
METDDPIIQEIREVRRRIQEQCGNDIHRMTLFYMEEQKKYADRLVHWEHPDEILDFEPIAADKSKP